MSSPHPDRTVSATVHLTGPQHATTASHGDREPGSWITVTVAGVVLWLHDRYSVDRHTRNWVSDEAQLYGRRLPTRPARARTVDDRLTVATHARPDDTVRVDPLASDTIIVTTGAIRWIVHDQAALAAMQHLWLTLTRLAALVLPDHDTH